MNFLENILEEKRREVELSRLRTPLRDLQKSPWYARTPVSLSEALRSGDPAVIAEIKKASPSRGVIRADFDPVVIARQYLDAGARALSILTDRKFFQGEAEFIGMVRPFAAVPILRKDFILDSYQVHEAKAMGADAILLIAAALNPGRLLALKDEAFALGMESLVEVHDEKELRTLPLEKLGPVGINNRNLKTFVTELETSIRLRPLIPRESVVVSESGISSAEDIRRLRGAGIHAVLIGETFMRSPEPGAALARLLKEARS